jgi:hypothetical protein
MRYHWMLGWACCWPGLLAAQPSDDPIRFVRWMGQDGRALIEAIASPRTLYAGGASAVLLALHPLDRRLNEQTAGLEEGLFLQVAEELGNAKTIRPMAVLVVFGALMSGEHRVQDAAFTSLEAVVYANLMTNTLKLLYGRARPYQEKGADVLVPFSGNSSFPSGHATTAFALITPWVVYFPHYGTAVLYGLAGVAAFTRMVSNVHWFTDVVAGAALGTTTGYWLSRRHQQATAGRVQVRPIMGVARIGVAAQF